MIDKKKQRKLTDALDMGNLGKSKSVGQQPSGDKVGAIPQANPAINSTENSAKKGESKIGGYDLYGDSATMSAGRKMQEQKSKAVVDSALERMKKRNGKK